MVIISEVQEREKELDEIESSASNVLKQPIPQKRFGSTVTSTQQKEIIQKKAQAQRVLKNIESERGTLAETRESLSRQESQEYLRLKAEQYQRKGAIALFGLNTRERNQVIRLSGGTIGEQIEAKRKAKESEKIVKGLEKQGFEIIYDKSGKVVGLVDTLNQREIAVEPIYVEDFKSNQSKIIEFIPQIARSSPEELERFKKAGLIDVSSNVEAVTNGSNVLSREGNRLSISNSNPNSYIQSSIQEIQEPKGLLEKSQRYISKQRLKGGEYAFGAGLGQSYLNQLIFTKELIKNPIQTTKGLGKGTAITLKKFFNNEGFPEIGKILRFEPEYATGRILGELSLLKGTQIILTKTPEFTKVAITKINLKYRPVELGLFKETQLVEQTIKNIPQIDEIALIPVGKTNLKNLNKADLPPQIRGAFGFSKEDLAKFNRQVGIATSQRGFVNGKFGVISESEKGLGLFGTPREPITQKLITRISRLGESPRTANLLDILQGEVSFKLTTPKPQILIFKEEIVGKNFKLAPKFPSTELEVATKFPSNKLFVKKIDTLALTVIGKEGKTKFLGGRRVEILSVELASSLNIPKNLLKKLELNLDLSKKELDLLSKVTGFSKSQFVETKPLAPIGSITPLFSSKKVETLKIYRSISIKSLPTTTQIKTKSLVRLTGYNKPVRSIPTSITPPFRLTKPLAPLRTPPYPPSRPPSTPLRTPPYPPSRPPSTPVRTPPYPPSRPLTRPRKRQELKLKGLKVNTSLGYRAFVIKQGKKIYLKGIFTKGLALRKGEAQATQTLRATFGVLPTNIKIKGKDINYIPSSSFRGYKIKQGKRVNLVDTYIQKRSKRLSSRGEVKAIQLAKLRV